MRLRFKPLFLLLLFTWNASFAALTNRFVTDAGAGAGTGADLANAMSFATFIDYMVTGGSFTAAPGDVFKLCGVNQTLTTTLHTFVNGGDITSPVVIQGCDASGNPAYAGRTDNNGPLVTTNMPVLTYTTGRINTTGAFITFESLDVLSAATSGAISLTANCVTRGCRVRNSSTNAAAVGIIMGGGANTKVDDCDVSLTGASGGNAAITGTGNAHGISSSRISGGPAVGVKTRATTVVENCLIFDSASHGIAMDNGNGAISVLSCTITANGGDGINVLTGTTGLQLFRNNMITDNGGAGINMVSTSNGAIIEYNRFRDNTSGNITNAGDWITATDRGNVTTDTGGPETDYVDAGTDNYNLIATSPGTSSASPYAASMGCFQRLQTSSGVSGSTSVYSQ